MKGSRLNARIAATAITAATKVTGATIVGTVIVFRSIIRAEPNHGVACCAFIGKMFSEAANLTHRAKHDQTESA